MTARDEWPAVVIIEDEAIACRDGFTDSSGTQPLSQFIADICRAGMSRPIHVCDEITANGWTWRICGCFRTGSGFIHRENSDNA